MRMLTLAVVAASLALAGAAQVAQADCVGHKKQALASNDSSLTVTTTQPAGQSVAGTEKQTKKESGLALKKISHQWRCGRIVWRDRLFYSSFSARVILAGSRPSFAVIVQA